MTYKWRVFAVASLGTFMGTMDSSGLFVALPAFGQVFGAPPETVIWTSLAYTLTLTGFLLTAGRLADVVGRERIYTVGFLIFTLGLALCATAQDLWQLVAYRVLQGIGGAMLISNNNALVAAVFPDEERGKAIGLLEAFVGAGLMSGPVVTGFLLDLLDWRAIFSVRVPIGLLGLVLSWLLLRKAAAQTQRPRFDLGGSLTLFGGLVCLMVVINQVHRLGWQSPTILALGAAAAVLLALFVAIEARVSGPVIDLRLFKNRLFSAYSAALLTYFIPYPAIPLLLPFYLVAGQGQTASVVGLFLAVIPILVFALSPVTGILSDRVGAWPMTTAGLAIQGGGLFLVSRLGDQSSVLQIVTALAILGVGAGIFITPTYSALIGATPSARLGTASALIATLRSIGMAVGQASSATIFAVRRDVHELALTGSLDGATRAHHALIAGFQDAVVALGFVALVGLAIALAFARPAVKPAELTSAPTEGLH